MTNTEILQAYLWNISLYSHKPEDQTVHNELIRQARKYIGLDIPKIREGIHYQDVLELILMDVHLPGINGTIATKEIRKFNKKIPVIALTAISLNENRDILLSFGMNDVVTKPFDPVNFYNVIAKVLSKSKSTA